jgi:hypothetical protein
MYTLRREHNHYSLEMSCLVREHSFELGDPISHLYDVHDPEQYHRYLESVCEACAATDNAGIAEELRAQAAHWCTWAEQLAAIPDDIAAHGVVRESIRRPCEVCKHELWPF